MACVNQMPFFPKDSWSWRWFWKELLWVFECQFMCCRGLQVASAYILLLTLAVMSCNQLALVVAVNREPMSYTPPSTHVFRYNLDIFRCIVTHLYTHTCAYVQVYGSSNHLRHLVSRVQKRCACNLAHGRVARAFGSSAVLLKTQDWIAELLNASQSVAVLVRFNTCPASWCQCFLPLWWHPWSLHHISPKPRS
jgi:hypothetical protein